MQFNKINNILGWLCFIIASATYILTLEPSVSFWDCGEFIACAYRLQVSHQPGYPLFAMICKVFSLLSMGDVTKVAYFTNMACALASGATIMFLFWTITLVARKLAIKNGEETDRVKQTLILGAGMVGALAFAFTDTFWFSAVETIVFAMSALCTAIVFWAILKWDAHADEPRADRWIVFIAYVIGLSIGIHLLNLLTIPAIVLVYYFRRHKNINLKSGTIAFLISIAILGFVQFGIRGYTVMFAAYFDLFFVNTLGFGFGSGAFVFFLLLVGTLAGGIWYSIRKNKPALNLALLCVAFIYFGYGSFAYIPIRATANTDLNNSHPDNAFTMYGYLNRIQYPSAPLLSGPYFDAKVTDQHDGSVIYQKGDKRYEQAGHTLVNTYDHTTILPRIHSSDLQDPQFYRQWLQMGDSDVPNFGDNLKFMFSWQMYQMYGRYFLWNFAGRYNYNDGQQQMGGFHGYVDGDWTTGIFDRFKHLPKSVINGNTYTPLYALPLILGLIGLIYHFRRSKRDALVIAFLWFFTGLAIVLYVNQAVQPRERDYSYVCSFYAFAIWIGLGVIAMAEFMRKRVNARTASYVAIGLCLVVVPVLMAKQEWKAHDRSTKMSAHDMAYNYLISCPKSAILFTGADNDTYSLWSAQEVEGIRPDVRIVINTLFSSDWYIRQMQGKMNQSAPLPITMPYDKYKAGTRDYIPYSDAKLPDSVELKEIFDFITSDDPQTKVSMQDGSALNYLPTKNFKLTVNADEVIKNGVVTPAQRNRIADSMQWKFDGNYFTKDNLALVDILTHNNWKRPICFTTTMSGKDFNGLEPYLYKEGFVYQLLPFKNDEKIPVPRR
ncbi:MAG: glycosyltransferase family 117 protein [Mucilaginibacter sp.]